MLRLNGRGSTECRAIGRARIVRSFSDLLEFAPRPEIRPFWRQTGADADPGNVVAVLLGPHNLTLDDMPATVVAIVTESHLVRGSERPGRSPCPIVDCVGPAAQDIQDGDLVLVNGGQASVWVNPTARMVNAFQRSDSAGRFHLDYEHQPVRLPDGRPIRVDALVADGDRIASYLSEGPDGFVLTSYRLEEIESVVSGAHGKPVALPAECGSDWAGAAARSAALSDMTALLRSVTSGYGPLDLRADLDVAADELAAEGTRAGRVRVGVWMEEGSIDPAAVLTPGLERAFLRASTLTSDWLEEAILAAKSVLVPASVHAEDADPSDANLVIELGVAGIVVQSPQVQSWKQALRSVALRA